MCQVWIGSEYIKYTRQNSLSTVHKFVILPQSLGLEGPDLGSRIKAHRRQYQLLNQFGF